MPKCFAVESEITEEECKLACEESYKEKNGKELPKRFKRIIGWKAICKNCKYHEVPKKKK